MQLYFDRIDSFEDIGDVLRYALAVFNEQGIVRVSYHITPAFAELTSQTTAVFADGFSAEWLECYDREDFRSSDPIPRRVLDHGAMMTWQEAEMAAPNSPANKTYFKAMREHGLIHGFGIPLFGPVGRDGFASLDFGEPVADVPPDNIGTVRSVAQAGHQRICVLLGRSKKAPQLSEREIEVLTWAARGKSMADIAAILDISPDTAKTYAKRIYAKLEVSDRVGAVVKAMRMGIVRI
ncbi:autoinducer binding domain-containing protein [Qipengyuania nanhaisediminis]|uniref:helix-turn-helix transcriptional regulator n=1 Tax=Qipengyuania nanhaisediminis TaxID=604088 RepID=UPI0038B24FDD